MPGSGPERQSVIVHRPWQIRTGGDISLSLSPSPPRHRSETGSGTSTHAPPFFITTVAWSPVARQPNVLPLRFYFFPFAVSPAPPPSAHTHSYTLKYPRNCIIERHSYLRWIIIRPIIPPILSLFASLPLQRRLSRTSSSLTPPISLSLGLHLKLMITRRARAATLVDRQVWELRLTNWSDGSDPPGNKSEATAIKEQCLNLPLSESGTSWEQTRCDELAEKASQPINSLRLPLRERFKHSRPVLMIKTDIWARPRHYWFYPSCLGEKLRWEGVMIARFAFCDEIKRAGRSWNSIPKSKPQAVFHSWQQLLFTHRWRALKKSTAPFSSEAFSFTFYRSGHQINATHWCSHTHTHNQKL